MTWLDRAKECADLGEQARLAGNMEAFVEAITLAAQCLQVARSLERCERAKGNGEGTQI